MAESIDILPRARGRRRPPAEPPARAAPKRAAPAAASDCPRWLRDALARRGLRPSADRPVHRLLCERDLPVDFEEHEQVSVATEHDVLDRGLREGLWLRYRDRPDVFVAGDLMVYFDGPQASLATADRLAPDLMVAFGVPNRHRRTYPVWEVGKAPDFVLEIVSPNARTRKKDVVEKPALYRRMGAREYFLFDPNGRREPRLRGWRFDRAQDVVLPLAAPVDGMRGIFSKALGLHLCHTHPWPRRRHRRPGAGRLRWHDPASGVLLDELPDVAQGRAEQTRRADAAERQRAEQARRADAAEERAATAERQQAEQARRAGAAEERAATAERQRAEQAQRADAAERQRAEGAAARRLLEEKVAALEARLR